VTIQNSSTAPMGMKARLGRSMSGLRARSWTADERTAPKIKSQQPVRIPRNADPDALPDFAGFVITASEP
jgi:hypothetical protein